jgi:hypothetical protein
MENTTNSPPRSRRLAFQPMSDSEGVPPHPVAAFPPPFPFYFRDVSTRAKSVLCVVSHLVVSGCVRFSLPFAPTHGIPRGAQS